MVKTCCRCENEAKLPELPIGQKCLDALRAELRGYEAALSDPEAASTADRRAKIESQLEELRAELDLLPTAPTPTIDPIDPIDLDDETRALREAEANLEREIASATIDAEAAEIRRLARELDDAPPANPIEAEAAEVARLAKELDDATDPKVRIG